MYIMVTLSWELLNVYLPCEQLSSMVSQCTNCNFLPNTIHTVIQEIFVNTFCIFLNFIILKVIELDAY